MSAGCLCFGTGALVVRFNKKGCSDAALFSWRQRSGIRHNRVKLSILRWADWEVMTLTDILLVSATALSPVIAVQVTRYLDDRNEERGRKLHVFKTLMATRAYNISAAHVEALNRIDLEFSNRKPPEKAVLDVWQQYLDHLGNLQMEPGTWNVRRVDLLVDLLYAMGKAVGYDFNKTQIKNGTYSPTAHGKLEDERGRLRSMVLELLEGRRELPMRVTNIPPQRQPSTAIPPEA